LNDELSVVQRKSQTPCASGLGDLARVASSGAGEPEVRTHQIFGLAKSLTLRAAFGILFSCKALALEYESTKECSL